MKNYKIPWASWYKPDEIELNFPDSWDINFFKIKETPTMDNLVLRERLTNPLGTETLQEMAKGRKNAVIVVDDISRHTKPEPILLSILENLNQAGIPDDNITIITALGAHRPMIREDLLKKLGNNICNRINIENHHPYLNLDYVGDSKLGTPIHINKTYNQADLKISVSGVIPHTLAGYGGGAKIVLPGICGMETLEANHKATIRGIGIGLINITDLRKDIEDVCSKVGLDYSVNIVPTITGDIADVYAGDYIQSHRKTIESFTSIYKTPVPNKKFDVGFFNAYPEDTELSQSTKSLNTYLLNPKMVKHRGAIVMMSAASEGRGYHSLLFETGSPLFIHFGDHVLWKTFGKRLVCLYSPNVSLADVHHFYPTSIYFFREFPKLTDFLSSTYGETLSAFVFPSSIQIPSK